MSCMQVRALCTYFGQGTEFAANKGVERRRLQRLLFSDTNGYGMKPSGSMQQASAGDLLFLKGHAYPGNSGMVSASSKSHHVAARLCTACDMSRDCAQNMCMACRLRCCAQITACQPGGPSPGAHPRRDAKLQLQ